MPEPTRRSVLAAAAFLPVLAACKDGRAAEHASPATSSARPAQFAGPSNVHRLYTPSSAEYASAKQLFDPGFDARKPAAVAVIQDEAEVGNAVRYARAHHLRVAARSGGHSYVGASAPDGALVVDLRALSAISYDAQTQHTTIGAGARLYDVHTALAAHGRAIPTGTCPTVGVSGLTAGGGLGVSSRQYGLTSDALVSAKVVLADGRAITADAKNNQDVFWALRGGGGGLVGLVTQWTFATHPAASHGSFTMQLPTDQPEKVIQGWARWINQAPRTQWANVHIAQTSSGLSLSVVGITGPGEQQQAASDLRAALGVTPSRMRYAQRSHMETVTFLGGGKTSPRTPFTAGSDIIRTLDGAAASAIISAVRAAPAGCTAILDPLTGAVQDQQADSTAFPWRRHAASLQWYSGSTSTGTANWIKSAHRTVSTASAGRYINYVESGTALKDYLGSNSGRAQSIRQARDSGNLFVTSLNA